MITSFTDNYFFLSNFYPCNVPYEGIIYPSSEHAFVAAKSLDIYDKKYIATIPTAAKAKQYGRRLYLRPDWEQVKILIMKNIVRAKFTHNPELTEALLATGDTELVEGNYWHDTFWGQCPIGHGKNYLGKILMEVRYEKLHSVSQ